MLRFYRDFAADTDELGSVIGLGCVPHWRRSPRTCTSGRPSPSPVATPAPSKPASARCGPSASSRRRSWTTFSPTPYVAFQGGFDDTVLHGWRYYWKSTNLAGLSDDAIAVIADHAYAAGSRSARMFTLGGAVARVPHDAALRGSRRDPQHHHRRRVAPDESGEHAAAETAWARRFLQALQPHRAGGIYVNFLDSDDSSRVREAYGDQTYRRLAEVKADYDPDNAFHHNRNIPPG